MIQHKRTHTFIRARMHMHTAHAHTHTHICTRTMWHAHARARTHAHTHTHIHTHMHARTHKHLGVEVELKRSGRARRPRAKPLDARERGVMAPGRVLCNQYARQKTRDVSGDLHDNSHMLWYARCSKEWCKHARRQLLPMNTLLVGSQMCTTIPCSSRLAPRFLLPDVGSLSASSLAPSRVDFAVVVVCAAWVMVFDALQGQYDIDMCPLRARADVHKLQLARYWCACVHWGMLRQLHNAEL